MDLVEANKKDLLTDQYINDYLKKIESKRVASLIVPDIEQLKKGGRISNFKSLLVKMFGLKLIITLDKEGLIFRNKSSSIQGAVKKMMDEANILAPFKNGKIKRCVFFINEMNKKKFNIQEISDLVTPEFSNLKIEKVQLPAVITAHVGPNYFAIGLDIE
ncbi:hypothetical protein FACS1894218_5160 [Bacilli bacterium]|nr:hypothetical protein FACS1894218_5160 [Bacilli bacterium]